MLRHAAKHDARIGDKLIEFFHQHRFRENGQRVQWPGGEALVKSLVEARMGIGEIAQGAQRTRLVGLQLAAGPAIAMTKLTPQGKKSGDDYRVHTCNQMRLE